MERLEDKGARIGYHDPFVDEIRLGERTLHSRPLEDDTVADQDCVLILTAHPGIDIRRLARTAPLVFDTRGVTAGFDEPNVTRL
jgi:UDP-N-acetyl-D-glucosamine dehydrogenase